MTEEGCYIEIFASDRYENDLLVYRSKSRNLKYTLELFDLQIKKAKWELERSIDFIQLMLVIRNQDQKTQGRSSDLEPQSIKTEILYKTTSNN